MVGVAELADREVERRVDLAGLHGRLAGGDGVVHGRRLVGHDLGVAVEREGLDAVGHAVELAVVRRGLDGLLGVARQLVGGQVERVDRAVLDQVADPVVGADDDVGAVAGRVGGDEAALEVLGDRLDLDGDAVGLAEGLGDLLDGVDLERVGPDQRGRRRRRPRPRRSGVESADGAVGVSRAGAGAATAASGGSMARTPRPRGRGCGGVCAWGVLSSGGRQCEGATP